MRRFLVIAALIFICSPKVEACVGKVLNIGAVNSAEGQVLVEMLCTIINERTGTTVYPRFFRNRQELYDAVRAKQVDIFIENTAGALQVLSRPGEADAKRAYETVKAVYEREKGLTWLKPFGFLKPNEGDSQSYTATVLRVEILGDFPALPRVIDKLGGLINDEAHSRLVKSVRAGEKPRKVANDFLKARKLI